MNLFNVNICSSSSSTPDGSENGLLPELAVFPPNCQIVINLSCFDEPDYTLQSSWTRNFQSVASLPCKDLIIKIKFSVSFPFFISFISDINLEEEREENGTRIEFQFDFGNKEAKLDFQSEEHDLMVMNDLFPLAIRKLEKRWKFVRLKYFRVRKLFYTKGKCMELHSLYIFKVYDDWFDVIQKGIRMYQLPVEMQLGVQPRGNKKYVK